MAEVVLFHHVLGRTSGVQDLAERLRRGGHVVHTPDLYDGRVFATLDEGQAHVQEIGFTTIMERAQAAAEELPADVVYAGISLGVVPAQMLAQTRPGAKGALLLEACVPVSEFGSHWPAGVPVQVHGLDADPFFVDEGDIHAARALVEEAPDGELFLYPGDQHLFSDNSLASYDDAAAELLTERVLALLSRVA